MCYTIEVLEAIIPTEVIQPHLPGVKIIDSSHLLNPASKMAHLIWAPAGYGKTWLAGSLDAMVQKYEGKRVLYIAVEASDGGGAATIRKLGIPLFVPTDLSDFTKTVGYLRNDKSVGGVVLDSSTELYKQHVKPATLKYPSRENNATRAAGVFDRGDYQVAGELTSQILRQLMLMTVHKDPAYRKHLVVTAADYSRENQDTHRVEWEGPDLPGRMSREAVQLFQQVSTIVIRPAVVDGKRIIRRYLVSTADGVVAVKDRLEILPSEILLRKNPTDEGDDLCSIWEKYWLPNIPRAE